MFLVINHNLERSILGEDRRDINRYFPQRENGFSIDSGQWALVKMV